MGAEPGWPGRGFEIEEARRTIILNGMCVIFFAIEQRPETPLVLLANRDEFYERPTLAAAAWPDQPNIRGGRDLVSGGTWLGVTDGGRFAAVTNYRDPSSAKGTRSRGRLVSDFLLSDEPVAEYMAMIERSAGEYSGFNLIAGEIADGRVTAAWFSDRGERVEMLTPGIYGLSNSLLDTPWPKVTKGKAAFRRILENGADREAMFDLLADRDLADDADLPQTGIGYEREKALSAIFIETPVYGTRCSTVVTADRSGRLDLVERTFV